MQGGKQRYDYTLAGFDGFLIRSLDSSGRVVLGANPRPMSRAVAYDRGQQSGGFGDVVTIGKITIDGANGFISSHDDDGNEIARLGNLEA